MWGPDCPLIPPVWLLPLSFPHATVSPISQGLGFIKALALLPAAFCNIPDNKPEMGLLPDTQGQGGKTRHTRTAQRHKIPTLPYTRPCVVVSSHRLTRCKHSVSVIRTNAYMHAYLDVEDLSTSECLLFRRLQKWRLNDEMQNDRQTGKCRGLISNQSQDSFRTPLLDTEANKGKIKNNNKYLTFKLINSSLLCVFRGSWHLKWCQ